MLDIITALAMLVACLLVTTYAGSTAASVAPQRAYDVYDGITINRARWLLPAKQSPEVSATAMGDSSGSSWLANLSLMFGAVPSRAGDPGRWALQTSDGSFDSWAQLMTAVHQMALVWGAYGIVQGVILILLIVRWVLC